MKFKIGDKVKSNCYKASGKTGIVKNINIEIPNIGVDFGEDINGHNLNGHCINGYGWYFHETEIIKITEINVRKLNKILCLKQATK